MDFTLSEPEQAIADLTGQILGDLSTHERLRDLAAADDHVDTGTWAQLARSGVVGAPLPEEQGGAGLGFLAVAAALEQVGRFASPVPLLSSTVMAGMTIAGYGDDDQKARLLPGLADGSTIGSMALTEPGLAPGDDPRTRAVPDGAGHVLDGVKTHVADGLAADVVLVPATRPDGTVGVFVVDPNAVGVGRDRVETTTGHPEARLTLEDVAVDAGSLLGGSDTDGRSVVDFAISRASVGLCMMMSGAARAAIELAADYTKQRHQFDRPIATFQAVSQRAGNSYIDAEAITLTAYQAAWRLDQGLESDDAVSIAKYWAAEAGGRAVHAAVHVHGGVGVDRDYPLHRHFLLARRIELTLGHAEEQLARLGRWIAERA